MTKASTAVIALLLLAACSSSHATTPPAHPAAGTTGSAPAAAPGTAPAAAGDDTSCSRGLKGSEPGVVSVTCDGPAEFRITAGKVTKDLHGGQCHSAGDVWSANVGVLIDVTGMHGKYTGPKVDNVVVNNTAQGKATIQATLDGTNYFALGTATIKLSADRTSAHITGVSSRLSDVPKAPITVDVTCG